MKLDIKISWQVILVEHCSMVYSILTLFQCPENIHQQAKCLQRLPRVNSRATAITLVK